MTIETMRKLRGTAIAVARETGWRRPNGYGLGPVGQHRDSDLLAQSNFDVILADLRELDDRCDAVRFGHWAVGWVEEIQVPLTAAIAERVAQWVDALDGYPVADEDDFSRREYEEYENSWDSWLALDVRRGLDSELEPYGLDSDEFDSDHVRERFYALNGDQPEMYSSDASGGVQIPYLEDTVSQLAAELIGPTCDQCGARVHRDGAGAWLDSHNGERCEVRGPGDRVAHYRADSADLGGYFAPETGGES